MITEPNILPHKYKSGEEELLSYGISPETKRILWSYEISEEKEKIIFDKELALVSLLLSEHIFLDKNLCEKSWPEDARKTFAICAHCDDIFEQDRADAEVVLFEELKSLWEHYETDKIWGVAVWCMKKRKQLPQSLIRERIIDAGIWDIYNMGLS